MTRFFLVLMLVLPAACAAPVTQPRPSSASGQGEPAAAEPQTTPAPPDFDLPPPNPESHASRLPTENALKPERLIGLLDGELENLLGLPDFRRNDPPAQIWQYRTTSCLFDVFLYQDTARAKAYAVTHVEARGLNVNLVSDRDCFLSVLKDRKQG